MKKDWKKDKAWSDKFTPEIKRVLGEVFINTSSIKDDQMRNTDLICFDLSGKRIGCRVRKKEYFIKQYPFQFTIRSSRPRGTKTELQKIEEGWGDYFFYGFSDNKETGFKQWLIGDLEVFRQIRKKNGLLGSTEKNTDNSSEFLAFSWESMPPEFFIAISPVDLIVNDVCEYCLCPKVNYNGSRYKLQCPRCLRLDDYNIMIAAHKAMRIKVNGKPNA